MCEYRTRAAMRLFQQYVRSVEKLPCVPDGRFGPLAGVAGDGDCRFDLVRSKPGTGGKHHVGGLRDSQRPLSWSASIVRLESPGDHRPHSGALSGSMAAAGLLLVADGSDDLLLVRELKVD